MFGPLLLFSRLENGLKSLSGVLVVFAILTLILSACGTGNASDSLAELNLATPEAITSTAPPPIIITVVSTDNNPSFRPLGDGELVATARSNLTADQEQDRASEATATTSVQPTPTLPVTALPTYTPPASPEASSGEHFWLHRPVPDGAAVWTDKAYPYGSNRSGMLRTHHGVEFNVPAGTEVLATAAGTVIVAGKDHEEQVGPFQDFYGNVVVIQHEISLGNQPLFTLYGHLSEILVNVGQQVETQELIAYSGASGVADGPHLHLEVRLGENSYSMTRNPLLWLYPFPDRGVVAGRMTSMDGEKVYGYPLTLRRIDASSAYAGTATYADNSVNPDDNWQENFVFDDVVAGYYEITAGSGEEKVTVEFWVYPYLTTFIELIMPG